MQSLMEISKAGPNGSFIQEHKKSPCSKSLYLFCKGNCFLTSKEFCHLFESALSALHTARLLLLSLQFQVLNLRDTIHSFCLGIRKIINSCDPADTCIQISMDKYVHHIIIRFQSIICAASYQNTRSFIRNLFNRIKLCKKYFMVDWHIGVGSARIPVLHFRIVFLL